MEAFFADKNMLKEFNLKHYNIFQTIVKKLVVTFKKYFNIKQMFTEDNLATAQIAQLFGSELLKVQSSSQTDSGSVPDIVKIDPKQFLYNQTQMTQQRKVQEQQLMIALQKEAEAAYPIGEAQLPPFEPASVIQRPEVPNQVQPTPYVAQTQQVQLPPQHNVWESIANSLERIANSMERVDISIKKKRIKRVNK